MPCRGELRFGRSEGLDLLDQNCPIEWIITKSALQEGWDCPFAYILVSLNNTGSGQSMTQLVGRILRQPYQERTPLEELNESYVLCLHKTAGEIAREVKAALDVFRFQVLPQSSELGRDWQDELRALLASG